MTKVDTPAELAAEAKAVAIEARDWFARFEFEEARYRSGNGHSSLRLGALNRTHAAIDRLESLATLAASRTTPHRWLFTDEHGLECVTTLDPSLWNARSRNSRTNVTPLYAAPAPAAAERKPLTVREILAATCRITVTEFPEARDYDIAVARATERAHGIS
jgi:hypothetical protein